MMHRLKIEWMKIKPYRTFWIIFILYLIGIYGINYIAYSIFQSIYESKPAKEGGNLILGSFPYNFPNVWQATSYFASYLLILPGVLMIILFGNEYNFKTHRQNVIDGWSRKQFISVKLAMVFIMAIASTIMVFITAVIIGSLNSEPFSTEKMVYIFYFFIQALSYILTAVLLAMLFRRGGLAIAIYFIYIFFVDNILAFYMNKYLNLAGRYLPLESTDNLITVPVLERVQKEIVKPYNTSALLITAVLYLGIYIFLSYRKFQTDDL